MLSAASSGSDRFGGLEGYLFGGRGPPPHAAATEQWTNPSKAAAVPGQQVPAPKITASAAHPGRKTNTSIVYTRVCSQNAARIAGMPGNVTFVSKNLSAYAGTGTERRSVMAGLDAVNTRLVQRDDGRTTVPLYKSDGVEWNPYRDMWNIQELDEWRLDGVVGGNPPLSGDPTSDAIDGRLEATEAMNICLQGPASVLNVFQASKGFDQRIAPLDELFVGLFATRHVDHWSFQYHPFAVQALREPERNMLRGLGDLVGAWRLGRILDTKAAQGGWGGRSGKQEHRLTVNVCVEWLYTLVQVPKETHPVDSSGNYCFDATLGMRYGTEGHMPCPNPVLNAQFAPWPPEKESADAEEESPAEGGELRSSSPKEEESPDEGGGPFVPEGDTAPSLSRDQSPLTAAPSMQAQAQADAVAAAKSGFEKIGLSFDEVVTTVDQLLNSGAGASVDLVQKGMNAFQFLRLTWEPNNREVVAYARRKGSGFSDELARWVLLLDRLSAALSRKRVL